MTSHRYFPHAVFAALVLFAFAWAVPAAMAAPLPDGEHDYNAPGFVVRHAWVKFAWVATTPFRDDLSQTEEDARVARFFELNRLIGEEARLGGDPSTPSAGAAAAREAEEQYRDERADLENGVERILEGRLTATVKDAGLTRHIGRDVVWPPADIEFEDPPAVLVTSPRAEIRKESESLLEGDLPIERVQEIEADAERDGETSALVARIGGIATYPAIIPPSADYHAVLQHIAHEWMHHYLYFAPLGRDYFDSAKLRTLNETVANIVGREMGNMMYERYPLASQPALVSRVPIGASAPRPTAQQSIDFTAEMRGLRREVEALLAEGRIDEAELRMDEKRAYLAANGYYVRRINQAYFAFYGAYGDSAASIDPIGPKLESLRQRSETLEEFVERVREFGSESDLDAALGG